MLYKRQKRRREGAGRAGVVNIFQRHYKHSESFNFVSIRFKIQFYWHVVHHVLYHKLITQISPPIQLSLYPTPHPFTHNLTHTLTHTISSMMHPFRHPLLCYYTINTLQQHFLCYFPLSNHNQNAANHP